jgi:hypothetical protein
MSVTGGDRGCSATERAQSPRNAAVLSQVLHTFATDPVERQYLPEVGWVPEARRASSCRRGGPRAGLSVSGVAGWVEIPSRPVKAARVHPANHFLYSVRPRIVYLLNLLWT